MLLRHSKRQATNPLIGKHFITSTNAEGEIIGVADVRGHYFLVRWACDSTMSVVDIDDITDWTLFADAEALAAWRLKQQPGKPQVVSLRGGDGPA